MSSVRSDTTTLLTMRRHGGKMSKRETGVGKQILRTFRDRSTNLISP